LTDELLEERDDVPSGINSSGLSLPLNEVSDVLELGKPCPRLPVQVSSIVSIREGEEAMVPTVETELKVFSELFRLRKGGLNS